jgi:hypothetical protein
MLGKSDYITPPVMFGNNKVKIRREESIENAKCANIVK